MPPIGPSDSFAAVFDCPQCEASSLVYVSHEMQRIKCPDCGAFFHGYLLTWHRLQLLPVDDPDEFDELSP